MNTDVREDARGGGSVESRRRCDLTEATSISDARVGATVQGRYRILARLAAGGMGVVYQAERIEIGRVVAIKFLHPWIASDVAFRRRFETEARAMSRLAHPCCVSVIDYGEEQGAPFLVMDFVAGDTLRELSREGPMPTERAISIARQMLAGLSHAHERGITHRDVKPENVVVVQMVGLGDQVRILDFGVAKLRDGAPNMTAGTIVGTPSYMAPEQIRGDAVDARIDLYATGIVLFELLTGQRPFEAEESAAVFRMHQESRPPRLSEKLPRGTFSPEIEAVVARALEKRPDRRFQSAADFAGALALIPEGTSFGSGGFSAPPPRSLAQTAAVPPSRSRAPAFFHHLALGVQTLRRNPLIQQARIRERLVAARRGARALFSTRRRRIAWSAVALLAAAGAVGAWRWMPAPRASGAAVPEHIPGLAEAWSLAEDGRRDAALAALSRLRREHPQNASVAFAQGQVNFRNYRWLDGLDSYRAAVDLEPAYRRDEQLITDLIRCLDSDRFHAPCATFLQTEIGADAVPHLEEAARSHPLRNVRYRAAWLWGQLGGGDSVAQ